MSLYTNEHLFGDACQYKGRLRVAPDRQDEVYREIWNALNDWMYELFTAGRGVNLPFFGLLTWAVKDVYEGEVGSGKFVKKRVPKFFPAKNFIQTNFLDMKYQDGKELALVKQEEFNATRLAIKYSTILTKDAVFSGGRDLFERLGLVAGNGLKMAIDFDIGRLVVKNRRAAFQFNNEIVQHQNNPQLALGTATIDFGGEDKSASAKPSLLAAAATGAAGGGGGGGGGNQEDSVDDATGAEEADADLEAVEAQRAALLSKPTVPELELDEDARKAKAAARAAERERQRAEERAAALRELEEAEEVDLEAMSDVERLEYELQRAQAAVADLQTPVMQGAYQRHIDELKQRIQEERAYLLRSKAEHEALVEEEDTTAEERARAKRELVSMLERQTRAKQSARAGEEAEKRRQETTTLPVLASSKANKGAGPHGKVHTQEDKFNQKKMHKVLLKQMERKAARRQEEHAEKIAEEKRFIDHVKAVEESERARHFAQLQQRNNALVAEWETDRYLKSLEKTFMPRKAPHVPRGGSRSPQASARTGGGGGGSGGGGGGDGFLTSRSTMSNFSVGYDFRGGAPK